jgi:serine protease Do
MESSEIIKYLEGEMNQEEEKDFLSRVSVDPLLKKELDEQERILSGFRKIRARNELREKLENIHSEVYPAVRPSKMTGATFQRWYAIAASVLVLILSSYFILSESGYIRRERTSEYKQLKREVDQIRNSQKKINNQIRRDSIQVIRTGYSGTGFAISADGLVVTSLHLVKNSKKIHVSNNHYYNLGAEMLVTDEKADLAVLKLTGTGFSKFRNLPFAFRPGKRNIGDRVFTMGFPKLDIVYGEGYISSLSGFRGDTVTFQVAIPLNPGNSGAPLFNESGQVIGMISGKQSETEGAGFAVEISYLEKLLKTKGIRLNKQVGPSVSRSRQIRNYQDYIFEVWAE